MSRNLTRLALAAFVAVGFGVAPMLALAAGPGVDIVDNQFRYTDGSNAVTVYLGDDVTWHVADGVEETHTVTPYDTKAWTDKTTGSPDDLKAGAEPYSAHFTRPGKYFYFCKNHGGGTKDQREGMWGSVTVIDPNATTTTTTTAPPATTPTTAGTTTTTAATPGPTTPTTAAPASSAGAKPPTGTIAPAPTTTTAKDKKGKDDKKDEETTTTTAPPPPPIDLPDSAIIPVLPGAVTGSTTQDGSIQAPTDTPEGDAIALLKSKKSGGHATKLLILSGVGLGALGIGTAGYKYANRSSKYFPA